MVITIGGEKGGCSKSTTAINLAAYFDKNGHKTALLDSDAKPTSHKWWQRREAKFNENAITCERTQGQLRRTIQSLSADHEIVIVDCGGGDTTEQRSALSCSHIAIFPFTPSQADLDTIDEVSNMLDGIMASNVELTPLWMLADADTSPLMKENEGIKSELEEYTIGRLLKSKTSHRNSFRQCFKDGSSVYDGKDNKARAEIDLLGQEIINIMENLA